MAGKRDACPKDGSVVGFVQVSHVVMEERSKAACAVASWDGRLHLGWTGSSWRLNLLISTDGVHFGDKVTLEHRSAWTNANGPDVALAPALTATDHGVFWGWTGTDGRLNVLQAGAPENHNVILEERSAHGPALSAQGSELVLGWQGRGRWLKVARTRRGEFTAPLRLDHRSRCAPALVAWRGQQLLAWAGTDQRLNVLAHDNPSYGQQPTFLGVVTTQAPAMCTLNDDLVVAWTGPDRALNLQTARAGSWGPIVSLPHTTRRGPALCWHRNDLVLAWTGTDRHLNVAVLRPLS